VTRYDTGAPRSGLTSHSRRTFASGLRPLARPLNGDVRTNMSLTEHPIPPDVERIYKSWVLFRRSWWLCHYFIGIVGVLAAITVANKPQFLQNLPLLLNGIAWLSAVCVALLTFLEPKKRARAYTAAWRILHKAIGTFRHSAIPQDPAMLFEAIAHGEELIAKLDG